MAVATPSEWATITTGRVEALTSAAMLSTQSSRTGFYHSACSTRRAVDNFSRQRLCQWPGPELVYPGTIRISTSDAFMGLYVFGGLARVKPFFLFSLNLHTKPLNNLCFAAIIFPCQAKSLNYTSAHKHRGG